MIGAVDRSPESTDEMFSLIQTARRLRMTSSTVKNDHSSRSHAVCQFIVKNMSLNKIGSFLLVDLAGSEAKGDFQHHTDDRFAETREINKSLTVLKSCIEARARWSIARGSALQKHVHIPFRNSRLTRILKNAFDVNSNETIKTLFVAAGRVHISSHAYSRRETRSSEIIVLQVVDPAYRRSRSVKSRLHQISA
jgi:kinesin family member 2/24